MLLKVLDVLPTVPLAGVGGDAAALVVATTASRTTSGTSSRRRRLVLLIVTPLSIDVNEILVPRFMSWASFLVEGFFQRVAVT
jgi:hypothetical protein